MRVIEPSPCTGRTTFFGLSNFVNARHSLRVYNEASEIIGVTCKKPKEGEDGEVFGLATLVVQKNSSSFFVESEDYAGVGRGHGRVFVRGAG